MVCVGETPLGFASEETQRVAHVSEIPRGVGVLGAALGLESRGWLLFLK